MPPHFCFRPAKFEILKLPPNSTPQSYSQHAPPLPLQPSAHKMRRESLPARSRHLSASNRSSSNSLPLSLASPHLNPKNLDLFRERYLGRRPPSFLLPVGGRGTVIAGQVNSFLRPPVSELLCGAVTVDGRLPRPLGAGCFSPGGGSGSSRPSILRLAV